MGALWHRYSLMNTPTIKTKTREKQAEIARKTAEFVANGGKIAPEEVKTDANVRRYYAMSELAEDEE